MSIYHKGVSYYSTGTVELKVHFPEDKVCCFHCWMRYKDSTDRQMCRLLHKELYYINSGIREDCPLEFEEETLDEEFQAFDGTGD